MGVNARVPSNAPDQPDIYLKGSKFQVLWLVCSDSITVKEVKNFDLAFEGTTLSFAHCLKSYQNTKSLRIMCSWEQLNKNAQNAVFEEWMNSKIGVKRETVNNVKPKMRHNLVGKVLDMSQTCCKVGQVS